MPSLATQIITNTETLDLVKLIGEEEYNLKIIFDGGA